MLSAFLLALAPQFGLDPVRVSAEAVPDRAAPGATVELHVRPELEPGWHLYHPDIDPMNGIPVAVAAPEGWRPAGPLRSGLPPVPHYLDLGGEKVEYLWLAPGDELILPLVVPAGPPGEIEASAEFSYQVCDDSSCLPPDAKPAVFRFTRLAAGGGAAADSSAEEAAASAAAGAAPEPEEVEPPGGDRGLLAFLLLAVAGGLFALVMPCTYPMIPITISFFTKQAEARQGRVLPLSLAYGAGIVLIFVLIGVVVGPVILVFATHPVTNLVIGALFLFFALVLFGFLTLEPPQFLMRAASRASTTGGLLGVFLMGATLVVTSFTCTAPFVGSLLSFGAAGGDLLRVALGMAVFGLTMAVPFVLLSLVPGRIQAMPRSGEWMNTLKVTLGFVEVAAAMKFLSNTDIVWGWGILPRERFLLLWAVIFLAAALYLAGVLPWKGGRPERVGRRRALSGILLALFAAYCLHGWTGARLDNVMTAIVPNYSFRRDGGERAVARHEIVVDDYQAALASARAQGRKVLVNFTGYT
ncbi:MAG: hypothetical protein D6702_08305 [Planctomycetota bacterium]|nr:MAG: hypothetical protein D6702_08305 [Planctomycetota bacterium]